MKHKVDESRDIVIYKVKCTPVNFHEHEVFEKVKIEADRLRKCWNTMVRKSLDARSADEEHLRLSSRELQILWSDISVLKELLEKSKIMLAKAKSGRDTQEIKLIETKRDSIISELKEKFAAYKTEKRKVAKATKFKYTDIIPLCRMAMTEHNVPNTRSGEALFESFVNSHKESLKPNNHRGHPRFKNKFGFQDAPPFRIRYSGGRSAMSLENVNRTFYLEPKRPNSNLVQQVNILKLDKIGHTFSKWRYFRFGLDNNQNTMMRFKCVEDRPFMTEGWSLQRITLRHNGSWWQLVLMYRAPGGTNKREQPSGKKSPVTFVPRWSKTSDDLLVGEIVVGNISRPIFLSGTLDRHEYPAKYGLIERMDQMDQINAMASNVIEDMKEKIKVAKDDIEANTEWRAGPIHMMGNGAMGKLHRILQANEWGKRQKIFQDLSGALILYRKLMKSSANITRRMNRHRDWCYWNVANNIARMASVVYLVKPPGVALRKDDFTGVPENVKSMIRRNRRVVAHGDLYQKIRTVCSRYDVEVLEVEREKEQTSQTIEDQKQKKSLRKKRAVV